MMELELEKYVQKAHVKGLASATQNNIPSETAIEEIGFNDLQDVTFFSKFFGMEMSDVLTGKNKEMIKSVYDFAKRNSDDVPSFIRGLSSGIGLQPGISPLKSIYAWIEMHKQSQSFLNK